MYEVIAMYRNGDLETVFSYLVGNRRVRPTQAHYLETIWFLSGQPEHLPPLILSSIDVSPGEHRDRLVAQVYYAAEKNMLFRLAQYLYLIPDSEWVWCVEPPDREYGIATQALEMEEAIALDALRIKEQEFARIEERLKAHEEFLSKENERMLKKLEIELRSQGG